MDNASRTIPGVAAEVRPKQRSPFDITVRSSITRLVWILILGCLTAAALIIAYLIQQERQHIANEALGIARAAAHAADREITGAWALMSGLSTSPALQAGDLERFRQQLIDTPKPPESWIVLLAPDGTVLASSRYLFGSPKPRLACGEKCQATFQARQPQVTDLVMTSGTSEPVIRTSMPVVVGDRVAFALGMPIPSESLARVFGEKRVPDGWIGTLYDRQGTTIARSHQAKQFVGQPLDRVVWNRIGADEEGVFRTRNEAGDPILLAYSQTPVGWVAATAVPRGVMSVTPTRVTIMAVGSVALLGLIGIAVAAQTSRRIEQPVRELETAAAAAEREKVAAEREKAELASLHTAFWESTNEDLFVVRVTPDGHFLFEANNPVSERTSGITRAFAYGKEPQDLVEPETAARWTEHFRHCVERGEPIRYEDTATFASGTRDWEIVLAPVRDESGTIVRLVGSGRDITDRKRAEAEVRNLVERLLRAEDDERQRIARELHDSTGQYLVGASIILTTLDRHLAARAVDLGQMVADIDDLINKAQTEIRVLSYLMHPPGLADMGLPSAIRLYVEGFAQKTGLDIDLRLPANLGEVAYPTQLALFRILQEALTNVHRHAQATCARVRLVRHPHHVALSVVDNGTGCVPSEEGGRLASYGLGLTSMSVRVRQLGGSLRVRFGRGGAGITARIPASEPAGPAAA